MEFYLPIKFSALLVTYKYHTKILLVSIKGEANGKIENLTVNVKLSYDYSTYQASLDKFEIKDSGRFSLRFTGNGLLDWMTNTMTSVVTLFLQPVVIRIVQAMIKGGLQAVVDAINEVIRSIFTP
ncbi:hypothetical protein NQ315_014168 [Exocentrus adspersus]|uniref:Uncharacterized protein n=1 Tax=Exocentrus adspersus TaxID=1586481 RepID=A0AAV8VVB3_9CUCU|nr:hypothetical protein NQ315_014168 [Exocentrus adspersus]